MKKTSVINKIIKTVFLSLFLTFIFALTVSSQSKTTASISTGGKAIVYFYSLKTIKTLGQVKKPVFVDDAEIASIRPERFFIVLLEPGTHNFHLKDKKFGGIEMDFVAGEIYYIRMDWQADAKLKPSGISLIPKESGAFDIKQLKPVDAKNIKNKEFVFTVIE